MTIEHNWLPPNIAVKVFFNPGGKNPITIGVALGRGGMRQAIRIRSEKGVFGMSEFEVIEHDKEAILEAVKTLEEWFRYRGL